MYRHSFVALLAVVATATVSSGAVSAAPLSAHGSEALSLVGDRETAAACIELAEVAECFDTEAELLAAHPDVLGGESGRGGDGDGGDAANRAAASSCSSSVRLYTAGSFGGAVLYLTTRWGDPQPRRLRVRQRHVELPGRRLPRRVLQPRRLRRFGLPGVHRRVRGIRVDDPRLEQRRLQRLHLLTAGRRHGPRAMKLTQQCGWLARYSGVVADLDIGLSCRGVRSPTLRDPTGVHPTGVERGS